MKNRINLTTFIFLVPILMTLGCAAGESNEINPDITGIPTVALFQITTPTVSLPTQIIDATPTAVPIPVLSPTPFVYTIIENDTLNGLAYKFDVTLNELLAANPAINPQYLSIGMEINIPISDEVSEQISNDGISLQEVTLGETSCIEAKSDGVWCYLWVENKLDVDVDTIEIEISILDGANDSARVGIAHLPINRLRVGDKLPAVVYFPSGFQEYSEVNSKLISAYSVIADDRYYSPSIKESNSVVASSGLAATWKGKISFSTDEIVNSVTVSVIGYDANEDFVGVNNYQFAIDEIIFDEDLEFSVYSILGKIDSIRIFVEGRP